MRARGTRKVVWNMRRAKTNAYSGKQRRAHVGFVLLGRYRGIGGGMVAGWAMGIDDVNMQVKGGVSRPGRKRETMRYVQIVRVKWAKTREGASSGIFSGPVMGDWGGQLDQSRRRTGETSGGMTWKNMSGKTRLL